jgi:maltose alpha-D-glucosyltransferase/alpha-amylase
MAAADSQTKRPEVAVTTWDLAFDDAALARIADVLPAYVTSRRWFRAKARTVATTKIFDALTAAAPGVFVLFIDIEYEDGGGDRYVLPVKLENASSEIAAEDVIVVLRREDGATAALVNALSYEDFRQGLLEAIIRNQTFEGQKGELVAWRTKALVGACDSTAPRLASVVSGAEQSNSSIIFGKSYILKLFRKLEEGINPDVEIGNFLTGRGFKNSPAVLGNIDYKTDHGRSSSAVGLLQEFVPNQGDAWKYTLDSLGGFFGRALGPDMRFAPARRVRHALELMKEELPADAGELLADYVESAILLGRRTAQMHAALTDTGGGPDFALESFTAHDGERLYSDMIAQADIAFELLRRKQGGLSDGAGEEARELLEREARVTAMFEPLKSSRIETVRIRHHGDYHLGQVLYTGKDFMIIDYEGEPARPLPERRRKQLALRDVAGMLRSFQYAAFAALFGQVPGVPSDPEKADAVESWAVFWTDWAGALYLRGYFDEADQLPSVPSDEKERRILLDAFILQKALYELAYELNNRPSWVGIPLRGILSLVA